MEQSASPPQPARVTASQAASATRARARESARLLALAVSLAWSASPALLVGLALLAVVQAALPVAQLTLSRNVLDGLLGTSRGQANPPGALPLSAAIALAALAVAASRLIQPVSIACETLAGDRLAGHVTGRLIGVINSWRGLARFEDPSFADDLRVARERAYRAGLAITHEASFGATELLGAGALVATLARLHPLAALLVVLASLPQMMWQWEHLARTTSSIYVRTPDTRRLQHYRAVVLDPEPAKDVRLLGLASFFDWRYDDLFERTMRALRVVQVPLTARLTWNAAVAAAGAGVVYGYVAWQALHGALSAGDVVLYGGAATMLHAGLLDVAMVTGVLPRELGYLPALDRVLNAPPDLPLPAHPRSVPSPIRDGIAFEDVWFTYPGAERPVLAGVSFALRPGDSVALVGHNGAGKTTIVKLLLRLYDPCAPPGAAYPAGRITLDGVDLREYDPDALRRRAGVAFQDFVRYDLTARQNVALGELSALSDDARLREAAHKAGADGLIERLPNGWETVLGLRFGGRDLSGGEWQKLALARAFVRDCDLLVLDEPTAELDAQTEHDVYARFHELTKGKTTLLISHRFSTVRMADRILYLDGGRITEEGTHEALLARGGEYTRLYRLQASKYSDADISAHA